MLSTLLSISENEYTKKALTVVVGKKFLMIHSVTRKLQIKFSSIISLIRFKRFICEGVQFGWKVPAMIIGPLFAVLGA